MLGDAHFPPWHEFSTSAEHQCWWSCNRDHTRAVSEQSKITAFLPSAVLGARLLRSNPLPFLCTSPYHPQLSCSGMLTALLFSGDVQPFLGLFCSPLLTFIKKDKSFLHLPEGCYGSSEEICKN